MIEKILDYSGIIFSVIGIICLFLEAFATFKRKSNTKLMIAGMIFLAVSVIGSIITGVILREKDVPYLFTIIWIALLWAYLICNIVSAFLTSRRKRKEDYDSLDDESSERDDSADEDSEE